MLAPKRLHHNALRVNCVKTPELPVPLRIVRSVRKTVQLRVTADAVEIRAPYALARGQIDAFIAARYDWIIKHAVRLCAEREALTQQVY